MFDNSAKYIITYAFIKLSNLSLIFFSIIFLENSYQMKFLRALHFQYSNTEFELFYIKYSGVLNVFIWNKITIFYILRLILFIVDA